ncbi:MAG: antibiotic biosynthesis monooxygenase [Tannerellaceae bacterium]|jgi:quinol monooxygenase YgiN|nr:antibiotic biosynthesis monooxygenase [Tannerellaceae bacterium]
MKNIIASLICSLVILSGCSTPGQKTETASCEADKASMKLVMNLTRKVKPEHVSAFKASFEKCKVETLNEPGCLDYGMYQSYTDSTEFIIVETWENKGEHLKHMETEHLKVHIQEIKDMGDPNFKAANTNIYVCPNVN